tara:strand:- start:413 stop:712 length:300 start_codon:yes stop_codon:yes gene_type:complete
MNTVIITIYALAILITTGEPRDFYSKSLTFQSKIQCVEFFKSNRSTLFNGLMEYARNKYEQEVAIREAGCALVDYSKVTIPGGKPTMIQKETLYTSNSI